MQPASAAAPSKNPQAAKQVKEPDTANSEKNPKLAKPSKDQKSKPGIAAATKKRVLANGLTVFVMPIRGSGIVAVSAKIRGGQNIASQDKTLVPELTGEMLNRGSTHLSKDQLADTLETMGSSFEPTVESFWTSIDSEVVTEDLDKYLSTLAEIIREPLFKADELQKLKKQKESDIKDNMVETSDVADNKLLGMMYKSDCVFNQKPYDKQLVELAKISIADLKDFHTHHYTACNAVLAIVGDISEEQGFKLAEKHFGAWTKGSPASLSTATCKCDQQFKIKTLVSNIPDKSNVDIIMGYPANVSITSKDFCASQLANAALGHDTLASRLAVIREKYGLTYDVHSGFAENAEPWAPWVVQLSVNPENKDKALKLVNDILTDFMDKGMTASELATEKKRVAGEYLVYRMRTPKQLADALTKYGALGMGPDFMDRYPSMLNAVTLPEANAAIKKYMQPGNLVTSLAGTLPAASKSK
jgi:zinc protease